MANIEIKRCKIGRITKEGLTKNGEQFKMFSVAEGIKDKQDKYQNQYFNCFAKGDICKLIYEDVEVALTGSLNPNNWEKDGKTHYDKQLYVKNLILFGQLGVKHEKKKEENAMTGFTDIEKEEPVELPFD